MSIRKLLAERRTDIISVAARHGASNVRVIGSVARGHNDSQSDIDLLVHLEKGRSLLDHAALIEDLQLLLGRKVDVASEGGMRPAIRARVMSEAEPL